MMIYNINDILNAFRDAESNNLPLTDVMIIDWKSPRVNKNNTCQYVTVKFKVKDVLDNAVFRFKNEVHSGQISPTTEDDIAEMKAKFPSRSQSIKCREDRPACLQFRKWRVDVATDDNGSPNSDEHGNSIYPSDEHLSSVVCVVEYMERVLMDEVDAKIESGFILCPKSSISRRGEKKPVKKSKDNLIVPNTNLCNMVQREISLKNPEKGGMSLANPIIRIKIKCNDKTGTPIAKFYDKNIPFYKSNKVSSYQSLVTESGDVPNNKNLHELITPRSIHTGIVYVDNICFSSMGISLPMELRADTVEQVISNDLDSRDLISTDDSASDSDSDVDSDRERPKSQPSGSLNRKVFNSKAGDEYIQMLNYRGDDNSYNKNKHSENERQNRKRKYIDDEEEKSKYRKRKHIEDDDDEEDDYKNKRSCRKKLNFDDQDDYNDDIPPPVVHRKKIKPTTSSDYDQKHHLIAHNPESERVNKRSANYLKYELNDNDDDLCNDDEEVGNSEVDNKRLNSLIDNIRSSQN